MFSIAERLQEVNDTSVIAIGQPQRRAVGYPGVALLLPQQCLFSRSYFNAAKGHIEVGTLRVNPELRGHRIGDRLTRSLGALAWKYGYADISAAMRSQYALDCFMRVFGEDRLAYQPEITTIFEGVVPETYEQARQILVDLEPQEANPEIRDRGVSVQVDLDGLDMSKWLLPKEIEGPGFEWAMILRP